ncbi:MAG: hypothetical protein WCC10_05590, partial [Tumebacillaceae bacterium]
MLFTISLSVVGLITVFAMIMMIGNVLAKSRYGKTWAMVAGGSLLMAGLLLVVQMIAPDAAAQQTASAENGKEPAQTDEAEAKSPDQPTASAAAVPGTANAAAEAAGDGGELAYLTAVLDNLK